MCVFVCAKCREVGSVLNVTGEDEVDGDDEKIEDATRMKTAHLMLLVSAPVLANKKHRKAEDDGKKGGRRHPLAAGGR